VHLYVRIIHLGRKKTYLPTSTSHKEYSIDNFKEDSKEGSEDQYKEHSRELYEEHSSSSSSPLTYIQHEIHQILMNIAKSLLGRLEDSDKGDTHIII
jgi:hypothetical protein